MVMNLRERPDEHRAHEATAPRRKSTLQSAAKGVASGVYSTPAKRSRRSVYVMEAQRQAKSNDPKGTISAGAVVGGTKVSLSNMTGDSQQKKQLASLESRTLMRSLESYGHNYAYIQSVALPIYGNPASAQKSTPQLRARCQQLFRSVASSASTTLPKRLVDLWIAKEVFVPPPSSSDDETSTAKIRTKRAVFVKPQVEGTRKSSRAQKFRTLLNL